MPEPQRRFTQDFQDEAVRLGETGGRSRREIAQDLGIGLSSLRHWIDRRRERRIEQPPQDRHEDVAAEVEAAAAGERDPAPGAGHPKEGHGFFRQGGKSMRFRLIDVAKEAFPVQRLCTVLDVSPSGYVAWKGRPTSRRQREDLVLLAQIRSSFALSGSTYGTPRMSRELQDEGFHVGRRRTARLMRENGLNARPKRRFKRTTDSHHTFSIAPNPIDRDFSAERPNQKWAADISYLRTAEGWLYLAFGPGSVRAAGCRPGSQ